MVPPHRQQRALLLHLGLVGVPHAVAVAVGVGLCLRDVLHQYGGPGDVPGWAMAWFASVGLIVVAWSALALRWWRGGAEALRACPAGWAGLRVGIVATAAIWLGLLQALFPVEVAGAPQRAVALILLLPGIPMLSCAAHLVWLRRRAA
ncbi:hypothetical protein [Stenotrophomonas sp. BIGb0135]|jgi:hypothetical protein|uniref:hypothetical protein n=1 Tax=Stenotrophomonas sp. BIGb0135 TaxID=2940620 RepID=UPI0021679523|nr:hypothetical protein [Stenotrophomonas sp. BIGb0135]MCS4236442.1 hypothetical protein [Stenotrophomonas sp. BIGb0135]